MELKHPQSDKEAAAGVDSTHRKFFHRQVNVPPLLVKRIHTSKANLLTLTKQLTDYNSPPSTVDESLSIQKLLRSLRHAISQEVIDTHSFENLMKQRQRLRIQKLLLEESSGYLTNPDFLCILSDALAD